MEHTPAKNGILTPVFYYHAPIKILAATSFSISLKKFILSAKSISDSNICCAVVTPIFPERDPVCATVSVPVFVAVDDVDVVAEQLGLESDILSAESLNVFNKINDLDKVLADVPCSGLGIIFKKPDIKYKSIENINNLPKVQYEILSNCANYVKKDGILVYSTCTLNKAENQDNVSKFLEENKNFTCVDFEVNNVKSENGYYTFMPHINETDGFFVAKFKRIK